MKNELLHIGPFTVYGYGLMIGLGILACYVTIYLRMKKKKMAYELLTDLAIVLILGGLLGAKVLFWIVNLPEILRNPWFVLESIGDGFVVYGGIIGGILTGYLFTKWKKMPFLSIFDVTMPSIALAQAFGRMGCFLAGCCYGKETDSFLHVVFRTSDYAPNGMSLIPTQLYACSLDLLHFFLLCYIEDHKKKDGETAVAYLIFYSLGRFVLEFFRGDLERGFVGVLSVSQFLSVLILLSGLFFYYMLQKREGGSGKNGSGGNRNES